MTINEMIDLLNQDLANEYKHHRFYLHASFVLVGAERLYFGPWLENQAKEELAHIKEFADKITALGGVPTVGNLDFPQDLTRLKDILSYAIQMEQEVIANYHTRLRQAEDLTDTTGQFYDLVLLFEEQIEDSQHDVDEMVKMAVPPILGRSY